MIYFFVFGRQTIFKHSPDLIDYFRHRGLWFHIALLTYDRIKRKVDTVSPRGSMGDYGTGMDLEINKASSAGKRPVKRINR
jgi:hypothetical protein